MYWKNLDKLIRAISLLARTGGATISDFQEKLNISRRTVYRLLETIEEMNFPIFDDRNPLEREKHWKIDEDYVSRLPNTDLPAIRFSFHELLMLNYLFSHKGIFHNNEMTGMLSSLKEKISIIIKGKELEQNTYNKLDSIFASTNSFLKDYSCMEELIDYLVEAIVKEKTCTVTYNAFSTGKTNIFRIDPLKLIEHQGGLYVFVRVTRFGSIRILAIERIKDIKISLKTFEPPKDFDAESMLESAFQLTFDDPITVKVWFSSEQAPYIKERKWVPEQEIKENQDGSLILTLKTSGMFDVKKWILSFGKEARVIEPHFLAQHIEEEARQILSLYKYKS